MLSWRLCSLPDIPRLHDQRLAHKVTPLPFEINPRLSSTLLFRKRFGFDDAVWWMGLPWREPFVYRRKYFQGSAIRYLTEKYFNLQE